MKPRVHLVQKHFNYHLCLIVLSDQGLDKSSNVTKIIQIEKKILDQILQTDVIKLGSGLSKTKTSSRVIIHQPQNKSGYKRNIIMNHFKILTKIKSMEKNYNI